MSTDLIVSEQSKQELLAQTIQTALWHGRAYRDHEKRELLLILAEIVANTGYTVDEWVMRLAEELEVGGFQ